MPEQEPGAGPEVPPTEEQEQREPSYTTEDLLEAMVIAKDLPGARGVDKAAMSKRAGLVGEARQVLDRYKIGVEPDFDYLADVLDFVWTEEAQPELVGLSPEEVTKRKVELKDSLAQRESEFVKQAYQRLVERKQLSEE